MTNQLQTAEKQEKIIITLTPQIKESVAPDVRTELVQQYRKLFTGFSLNKWAHNNSWGRAWHNGMNMNGAILMIAKQQMTPNNPAVKYMNNVHSAYKKHWARMAMIHPQREKKPALSDQQLKHLQAYAMRMINEATNAIMKILQRYNERLREKLIEQEQVSSKISERTASQPMQRPAPQTPQPVAQQRAQTPVADKTLRPMQQSHTAEQIAQSVAEQSAQAQQVAQPIAARKPKATKPAAQLNAQPVAQPQPFVAQKPTATKQQYVVPSVSVNEVKAQKRNAAPAEKAPRDYVAPTVTERKNAFEMATNRQRLQQATAQIKLRTQIRIFTINQRFQNVA